MVTQGGPVKSPTRLRRELKINESFIRVTKKTKKPPKKISQYWSSIFLRTGPRDLKSYPDTTFSVKPRKNLWYTPTVNLKIRENIGRGGKSSVMSRRSIPDFTDLVLCRVEDGDLRSSVTPVTGRILVELVPGDTLEVPTVYRNS